ncbi:hypothetical protein CHS0354_018557 [Potamilus streckersoni]|uniref:Uncharacterized protein n=1 Tax=Potamilus streckersoni TaxID=2493646 RepID=A0AAE0WA18_9BIVA|nr:hypothetical protein CHS0354_018557 [Potamilus streckersoni]
MPPVPEKRADTNPASTIRGTEGVSLLNKYLNRMNMTADEAGMYIRRGNLENIFSGISKKNQRVIPSRTVILNNEYQILPVCLPAFDVLNDSSAPENWAVRKNRLMPIRLMPHRNAPFCDGTQQKHRQYQIVAQDIFTKSHTGCLKREAQKNRTKNWRYQKQHSFEGRQFFD